MQSKPRDLGLSILRIARNLQQALLNLYLGPCELWFTIKLDVPVSNSSQ